MSECWLWKAPSFEKGGLGRIKSFFDNHLFEYDER